MHILLLALLLQHTPNSPKLALPGVPITISKPSPTKEQTAPQLRNPGNATTPELNQNSPPTPYEMGRDIGGQGEAIGELKTTVKSLEDKREKIDRPDIDSLKASRSRIEWTWSIFSAVLGTLLTVMWYFRAIIWKEIVVPRLFREVFVRKAQAEDSSPAVPPATQS